MTARNPSLIAVAFLAPMLTVWQAALSDFAVQQTQLADRLRRMEFGGQLFTEYHTEYAVQH